MSKPFAVFDIDGTLFRSSLIVEFVDEAIDSGIFPKSASQGYQVQYSAWKQRATHDAYEDYINAVVATFLENIKGKEEGEVAHIGKRLVNRTHRETYVYTRELLQQLRKTHFIIAISGSNVEFLEPFVKNYGFDLWHGSELEVVDGKYTGHDASTGHHNKDLTLRNIIAKYELQYNGSIAVGDTAPDIPMLEMAQTAIAFNPSYNLFNHAKMIGWKIVVERKNTIYQLEKEDDKYILIE